MIAKAAKTIIFLCGLLVWWQARYIVSDSYFNGAPFEFGRVSLYLSQALFLVASIILIIGWKKDGGKFIYGKSWYITVLLFLLYLFLKTVFSDNSLLGYMVLFQWLQTFLFIFAVTHQRLADKKILLYGLISGGLILAIWSWLQWIFQAQFASSLLGVASHLPENLGTAVILDNGQRIMRAYAGLPHPNILGGYLVIIILLLLSQNETLKFIKSKILESFFLVLLTSALMLTFSRSAILGLVLGLLIIFIDKDFLKNNFKNLLLIFATVLVVIFSYRNLYFSRIEQVNYLENKSINERVGGYADYYKETKNNWVFGFGLAGYQEKLKQSNPLQSGYEIQPIHNSVLFLIAQIGIVGFLFLLVLLFLSSPGLSVVMSLAVLSLFDHYLVSYYSGLVLLSLSFLDFRKNRF